MAYGSIWVKRFDGVWVLVPQIYARNAVGWKRIQNVLMKTTATSWTSRINTDSVPPASPAITITGGWVNPVIGITAPSDADQVAIVVKRSTVKYPVSYLQDNEFDKTIQPDYNYWSQFWLAPGKHANRSFSYPVGTKFYLSVWAYDANGNYSTPTNFSYTIPTPAVPAAPVRVHKGATLYPTESLTWRVVDNSWYTANNYVYQGGTHDARGFWFYGNQLFNIVSNATRITTMQLWIERVNDGAGVGGYASIRPAIHNWQNRPAGSPYSAPGYNFTPGTENGSLQHGQGEWITIPSSSYGGFLNKTLAGFGLAYGATSFTDNKYFTAYGAGTQSGKVWMEWDEGS